MTFREIEKIILADGWRFKKAKGSHYSYVHPTKPGKITIPFHSGDLDPPHGQVHLETGRPAVRPGSACAKEALL